MDKTRNRFSPEVRDRAARMVGEHCADCGCGNRLSLSSVSHPCGALQGRGEAAGTLQGNSAANTVSPMADDAVRPGLSMPNR